VPELSPDIDQPVVTVVEINDPAIADQGIELIDQDAVQLTSNPFRARRIVVRLEGGVVVYHSTNQRIRTRTKTQQGLLAYVTFSPRAKGTVNGLPTRSERVDAFRRHSQAVSSTGRKSNREESFRQLWEDLLRNSDRRPRLIRHKVAAT
jgi:hypothetical protein